MFPRPSLILTFFLVFHVLISTIVTSNVPKSTQASSKESHLNGATLIRIVKDNGPLIREAAKTLQDYLAALLSSKEVVSMTATVLATFVITPFQFFSRILSKYFFFLGASLYVVSGLTNPWIHTFTHSVEGYLPEMVTSSLTEASNLMSNVVNDQALVSYLSSGAKMLKLDQEECIHSLSCQMGSKMGREYPWMANYLTKLAISLPTSVFDRVDNSTKVVLHSMALPNSDTCTAMISNCPTIQMIERYWFDLDTHAAAESILKAIQNSLLSNSQK